MAPTSTNTRRRVRKHPLFRFGPPVLASLMAIPFMALAVTGGGSSGAPDASPAAAVAPPVEHSAPDRVSRSAARTEEPAVAVSTTSTTMERVEVTRVTEERTIPVPKELHDDPALPRGETRVEADGSPGRERVVFEVTRRNGRITARRQISSELITPASPRVVFVGRGGGRGAPADSEEIPLKLRIADGSYGGNRPSASGPPARSGRQEGGASWYRYKPGTCAHRTLPKGTVVKVTNMKTGQSANCTVADRGPFIRGRIIDLDRSVFLAIAESPGQGVVQVSIEW
jgi:surface rod structure-forming protein G/rare lipoprotein A (RlpA)-like double-psi beta-barrel protein